MLTGLGSQNVLPWSVNTRYKSIINYVRLGRISRSGLRAGQSYRTAGEVFIKTNALMIYFPTVTQCPLIFWVGNIVWSFKWSPQQWKSPWELEGSMLGIDGGGPPITISRTINNHRSLRKAGAHSHFCLSRCYLETRRAMNAMQNVCASYSRHLALEVIRTHHLSPGEVWRLIIWVWADTCEDMTRVTCIPCDWSTRQRGTFVKTRTRFNLQTPKTRFSSESFASGMIKITKMSYPLGIDVN